MPAAGSARYLSKNVRMRESMLRLQADELELYASASLSGCKRLLYAAICAAAPSFCQTVRHEIRHLEYSLLAARLPCVDIRPRRKLSAPDARFRRAFPTRRHATAHLWTPAASRNGFPVAPFRKPMAGGSPTQTTLAL